MHKKTITLESGGKLTLSGEFNAFELSSKDQCLLEHLIESMDEFVAELADRL